MKPHKHAEFIKAWADGAEIQGGTDGKHWVDLENPSWDEDVQYRIKPNKRKYRVAEMSSCHVAPAFTVSADTEKEEKSISTDKDFVRWLTDWIEYDATNTEPK